MPTIKKQQQYFEDVNPLSKKEYREILLAKMAGGDMEAGSTYRKIKRLDTLFDLIRTKPIYSKSDLENILNNLNKTL